MSEDREAELLQMERRARREKKAEAGLCINCAKPRAEGVVHCESCREVNLSYKKQTYYACKARGVCVWCRCAKAATGAVLCELCRERSRARQRAYNERKRQRKATDAAA